MTNRSSTLPPDALAVAPQDQVHKEIARHGNIAERPRWEKEIERDLMLMLQTRRGLCTALVALDAAKQQSFSRDYLVNLLKLQAVESRAPVYFPLAGKSEAALGDALIGFEKLLLVECKLNISVTTWDEEADLKKAVKTPLNASHAGIPGARGKDRLSQLRTVEANWPVQNGRTPDLIARDCHLLVGRDKDADQAKGYLCFTPYWDFVMGGRDSVKSVVSYPIDDLATKGAGFQEFSAYVMALMEARNASADDKGGVTSRMIVLALKDHVWCGAPLNDKMLAELKNAVLRAQQAPAKAEDESAAPETSAPEAPPEKRKGANRRMG